MPIFSTVGMSLEEFNKPIIYIIRNGLLVLMVFLSSFVTEKNTQLMREVRSVWTINQWKPCLLSLKM